MSGAASVPAGTVLADLVRERADHWRVIGNGYAEDARCYFEIAAQAAALAEALDGEPHPPLAEVIDVVLQRTARLGPDEEWTSALDDHRRNLAAAMGAVAAIGPER